MPAIVAVVALPTASVLTVKSAVVEPSATVTLAGTVAAAFPLAARVSAGGLVWLAAGGIAYTVGAIVFASGRPNPLPGVFGHHEIWHLLVLAGSGSHFGFMVRYVAG